MSVQFHLDSPHGDVLAPGPVRLTGWMIAPIGKPAEISIRVNDQFYGRISSFYPRPDVSKAFNLDPCVPTGFSREVFLDAALGQVCLEFSVNWNGSYERVAQKVYSIRGDAPPPRPAIGIDKIGIENLRCPYSRKRLEFCSSHLAGPEGKTFPIVNGVPHFSKNGEIVTNLLERGRTHGYSDETKAYLDNFSKPLYLDFGAGLTPEEDIRNNVVYLECVQNPNTDIVVRDLPLPFPDDFFDGIVSQAVFEHLKDPWSVVKELYRVLKPGGKIAIDTAFMQPFHADPDHYFNMTTSAVRDLFGAFEIDAVGVRPYQLPSFGIAMTLEAVRPHVKHRVVRGIFRILTWFFKRHGTFFDNLMTSKGHEIWAAGVFVEARKPANRIGSEE